MDDLNEHLASVFGEICDDRAEITKIYHTIKHRPDRKCIVEDCREYVQPLRRYCDAHKAERAREGHKRGYERQKTKALRLSNSSTGASGRVPSAGQSSDRPRYEEEVNRPHNQHTRPVFGCAECIAKARVSENNLLRSPR